MITINKSVLFFLVLFVLGLELINASTNEEIVFVDCRSSKNYPKIDWRQRIGRTVDVIYRGCPPLGLDLLAPEDHILQKIFHVNDLSRFSRDINKRPGINFEKVAWSLSGPFDSYILLKYKGVWQNIGLKSFEWDLAFIKPTSRSVGEKIANQIVSVIKENGLKEAPDALIFVRLNGEVPVALSKKDLDILKNLEKLYPLSRISVQSQTKNEKEFVFSLDNFDSKVELKRVSGDVSVSRKLDRLRRANSKAHELVSIARSRLMNSEIQAAIKHLKFDPVYSIRVLDQMKTRMLVQRYIVTDAEFDYDQCQGDDSVRAFTFVKPERKGDKWIPVTNDIGVCDYAFDSSFDEGSFLTMILHESIHQVGIPEEWIATYFSNIIYVLATGEKVTRPGYEGTFNFSSGLAYLQQNVKKVFINN